MVKSMLNPGILKAWNYVIQVCWLYMVFDKQPHCLSSNFVGMASRLRGLQSQTAAVGVHQLPAQLETGKRWTNVKAPVHTLW